MNSSSELSAEFQSAVVWAHHVCGAISVVTCSLVCSLILFETDPRGKAYRKYLLSLQLSSILADIFMSTYSPFVMFNCRVMYGDSALAEWIEVVISLIVYVALFLEVGFSYFACVYYRRTKLLAPNTRFNYEGWKQLVLLAIIQCYLLLIDGAVYYIVSELQSSIEEIHPIISWVKRKPTIFVINSDKLSYPALAFAICSALMFAAIILAMIIRLIREIKHGMLKASPATRRYQARAVHSLVMQGAMPSIFYAVPAFCLLCVHIFMLIVGPEAAAMNRTGEFMFGLKLGMANEELKNPVYRL